MLITDTVTMVGDARTTVDGYLVADVRVSRTGIQHYAGAEMGRPDLATVRVFRPEAEVFHADALASMAHRPVTLDHPSEAVTAANWKTHSVGQMGGEVARDGEYVKVPLILMDQSAIAQVQAGKRQLSVGYRAEIDWTAGTTADGQPYDAIQRGIRANHLAVVDAARAGPACRIGDAWSTPTEERTDMTTQKVTIDSITVDLSDTAAQVVSKFMADHEALKAAKTKVETDLTAANALVQTRDGEIVALKQQLTDATLTPAKLDAAVAVRNLVVADARKIAGDKLVVDGKTDVEIRRAAVVAKIGDAAAKDMTDGAIEGAFRVLAQGLGGNQASGADPFRQVVVDQTQGGGDKRAEAMAARDKRLADAWKPKAA